MTFAEWQASRGIRPWITLPQHRPALLRLWAARIKAAWAWWMEILRHAMRALTAAFRQMIEPMRNLARAIDTIRTQLAYT